jgi:hypothetical protein
MSKIGLGILLLVLFSFGAPAEAVKTDFGSFCTELLQAQPALANYSTTFTQRMRDNLPLEELKAVFSELYDEVGKCTSYEVNPLGQGKYQLILHSMNELNVLLMTQVNEDSGQVSGLAVGGIDYPEIQIRSWDDLKSALHGLAPEGKSSATLVTHDRSVSLSENPSDVFAIGSTFKLYILGALEQAIEKGEHRWDEILPLKEEWKSLPSGIMHTWPSGKEVRLLEYAENMISLSDNTATDHLLYFLGRENVEAMLAPMGNTHEEAYLPFLSTLEMFKLKWALKPVETKSYLMADLAERLPRLYQLTQIPREEVGRNGVSLDQPTLIDQLEWFATTPENCEAMFWLASKNSPQVRKVLSKNVPILGEIGKESSHWTYAGYKGGSEPGVLSMTFLLESRSGQRGCFAMSANNSKKSISLYRFMDIARKTLKFAEQKL